METRVCSVVALFFLLACCRPEKTSMFPGDAGDGPPAPSPDVGGAKEVSSREARADRLAKAPTSTCEDARVDSDEACDGGLVDGGDGCSCPRPHHCGDGILDTDLGEECDLGDDNGIRLDREGNPSDDGFWDARVWCTTQCLLTIRDPLH